MTMSITPVRVVAFMLALAVPASAAGQDSLARAKDFYAAASYDEALQVLNQLKGKSPAPGMTEIVAYQMLCLVALGRNVEATAAIQTIVREDPLFHPSEADASPRVRSFFETVRRPLLPAVARQLYGAAKTKLDRKDYAAASAEFDQVIALLDEIGAGDDDSVTDLRTLASGFRDLSKASTPPPVPVPSPAEVAAAENAAKAAAAAAKPTPNLTIYTAADTGVKAPVAIRRTMPAWHPVNAIDKIRNFRGSVELIVDERGKVYTVVQVSVHPGYDAALTRASRDWTFEPATRNGTPVRYRTKIEITLTAPAAK